MRRLEFIVPQDLDGVLVKNFLRRDQGISARLFAKLKKSPNGMTVSGRQVIATDSLRAGDKVQICLPESACTGMRSSAVPLNVVLEDEDILVVDKPPFMPVYPTPGHDCDTLMNACAGYFAAQDKTFSFHPVYRLDKNTSGMIILAKNSFAAAALAGKVEKEYTAVCEGTLIGSGTVSMPIRLKTGSKIQREVGPGGLPAVTHWKVCKAFGQQTLLRLRLETGRTHQIRVHMSSIGHPLAGDDLYGGSLAKISRQALHCENIQFMHPVTHRKIRLTSPVPKDIEALILHNYRENT